MYCACQHVEDGGGYTARTCLTPSPISSSTAHGSASQTPTPKDTRCPTIKSYGETKTRQDPHNYTGTARIHTPHTASLTPHKRPPPRSHPSHAHYHFLARLSPEMKHIAGPASAHPLYHQAPTIRQRLILVEQRSREVGHAPWLSNAQVTRSHINTPSLHLCDFPVTHNKVRLPLLFSHIR
jgi:hypothetical protein